MTIDEIRRNNLALLVSEYGSVQALAEAIYRSDSQVSQWINASKNSGTGKPRGMRSDSCRHIERCAGKPKGWMDAPHDGDASFQSLQKGDEDRAVFDLLDVQAACGTGLLAPDHPEVVSMMSMPVGMAQSLLGTTNKTGAVKIVSAANDSMAPTIEPDDLLFVDTSTVEYMSEGVYLLVHDGHLICKRLSRPGKDITVSSDNPHYKSWKWKDRPEQTRIVGRVLRALPISFKKFSGD